MADFPSSKPIFVRLADRLADAIAAGKYPVGERVPSVREYSAEVEVNPNTVVRSYELLEQRGLIAKTRGVGYFVTDEAPAKVLEMRRAEFESVQMPQFFDTLITLGISSSELSRLYSNYLKDKKNKK